MICQECRADVASTTDHHCFDSCQTVKLGARVIALAAALETIANHPHCNYDHHDTADDARQYAIGIADGHRCAAQIARDALKVNS